MAGLEIRDRGSSVVRVRPAPGVLAGALLCLAAYLAVFAQLGNTPLGDVPNHLARIFVMEDLLFGGGAVFSNAFFIQWHLVPYVSVDVVLAALVHVVGLAAATRIWLIAVVLALPVCAWLAVRILRGSGTAAMAAALVCLYLATEWHFFRGLFNFRFSVGLVLVSMALFWRLRSEWSPRLYAAFVAIVVVGYLVHLSAPVFVAAFAGASALLALVRGRMSFRTAVILVAPPVVVVAVHLLAYSSHAPTVHGWWGGPRYKLMTAQWMFRRMNRAEDGLLFAAFLAAVLWPSVAAWRRRRSEFVLECFVAAAVAVGLYIAIPVNGGDVGSLDSRALVYPPIFLMLAGIYSADEGGGMSWRLPTFAACLALANLVVAATVLLPLNSAMGRYRELLRDIPAGATVLPVDGVPESYVPNAFLHAGGFATIDRHALMPYLFAGDINPPMLYFLYRHRPPAPGEHWLFEKPDTPFDWTTFGNTYQYVVSTTHLTDPPFRAHVIRSNDVAELLQVDTGPQAAANP